MLCNPPYITAAEMEALDPSVADYEPRMALYGGEDGLDFYRNISRHWVRMMNPGGRMYFECGWKQAQDVAAIFDARGMHDIFMADGLVRHHAHCGSESKYVIFASQNNRTFFREISCKQNNTVV